VIERLRRVPWGIALFLVYGFLILAGVGLSLPAVVAMATDMPVSFVGLVVMALLAYTIFTLTLVLQRKAAARALTLGLASLTIPAVLLGFAYGQAILAVIGAAFAALLFRGLTRPGIGGWLNEV
jgi:succinate-acetate transporter protein